MARTAEEVKEYNRLRFACTTTETFALTSRGSFEDARQRHATNSDSPPAHKTSRQLKPSQVVARFPRTRNMRMIRRNRRST